MEVRLPCKQEAEVRFLSAAPSWGISVNGSTPALHAGSTGSNPASSTIQSPCSSVDRVARFEREGREFESPQGFHTLVWRNGSARGC